MTTLTNQSDEATEVQNIPGMLSPILEIQPEDGTVLDFINHVERGEQALGLPIYGKLYNEAGDLMPLDTSMALEFEAPGAAKPVTVSEVRENIRPYRSLSMQDQQNVDLVDRVKHILDGAGLRVTDVDTMYVSVDSTDVIGWDQGTRVQFDEAAVQER